MRTFFLTGFVLLAFAACTVLVESDPARFDVRDDAAPRLRTSESIALKNAYGVPTKVLALRQGHNRVEADLKSLTDTAIAMLERRMKKDGVAVAANAARAVTLRVAEPSVLIAAPFSVLGAVTLEAELGGGAKRVFRVNNNTTSESRALDGAILRSVVQLLNYEQFVAYVNGR